MNRGEIEQNLDYIQKCTDHYFINSNDPNYGFFVFCELSLPAHQGRIDTVVYAPLVVALL